MKNHQLQGFILRGIEGLGEHKRKLYCWDTVDGFYFQAGCFFGSYDEFKDRVENKYGENHAYIKAANFMMVEW